MPFDVDPPPPKPRASLVDVAHLADVSLATASRVLHGVVSVREDKRARVEEAARQLNYRPNAAARIVVTGRSPTVGVLVADMDDPWSAALARGALLAAASHRLIATVAAAGHPRTSPSKVVARLSSQRPKSLVVEARALGTGDERVRVEQALSRAASAGIAVVVVDGDGSDHRFPTLSSDHRQSVRQLVESLVNAGYAAPLVLTLTSPGSLSLAEILTSELESSPELTRPVLLEAAELESVSDVFDEVENLREFDVICCTADSIALHACAALRSRGLEPGIDIGVTGLGGDEYADDVTPRITTVDFAWEDLGERATELAIDGGPNATSVSTVRWRESTPSRGSARASSRP